MFLLDTNVVSQLRRSRPHGVVLAWLQPIASSSLFLSAVTVGEIQIGIEIKRLRDPAKAADLEQWLDNVMQTFQILDLDASTFRTWGNLMQQTNDDHALEAMIAATAMTRELTLATRNVRDFRPLGLQS